MTKQEQIKLYMDKLQITEQEAINLYEFDKAIDQDKKPIDETPLTKEQQLVIKKMTNAGIKTINTPAQRKQKENKDKQTIISIISQSLQSQNITVTIANKERLIKFSFNNNDYEITLTQKRKSK